MSDKRASLADAVARHVADGAVLGVGGQNVSRCAVALAHEIVRQERSDLTLVGCNLSLHADLLVGAGLVRRCECGSVNVERFGVAFRCRAAIEAGVLEIADYDHLAMLSRFLAAEMGVPFMAVSSLLGTDMCDRPETRWAMVQDPWDARRRALVVPALAPDVSIVHVQQADREGNLVIDGLLHHEPEMIRASRVTIATCDRLVAPEDLRRGARATIPGAFVAAVVELPHGAYPTASYGCYDYDPAHIALYQEAARAGGARFDAYVDRYVRGVSSHAQFVECARGDATA